MPFTLPPLKKRSPFLNEKPPKTYVCRLCKIFIFLKEDLESSPPLVGYPGLHKEFHYLMGA